MKTYKDFYGNLAGRSVPYFKLGEIVNQELANIDASTLKPTKAEIKKVSEKLGVKQVDITRALAVYNASDPSSEPFYNRKITLPESNITV